MAFSSSMYPRIFTPAAMAPALPPALRLLLEELLGLGEVAPALARVGVLHALAHGDGRRLRRLGVARREAVEQHVERVLAAERREAPRRSTAAPPASPRSCAPGASAARRRRCSPSPRRPPAARPPRAPPSSGRIFGAAFFAPTRAERLERVPLQQRDAALERAARAPRTPRRPSRGSRRARWPPRCASRPRRSREGSRSCRCRTWRWARMVPYVHGEVAPCAVRPRYDFRASRGGFAPCPAALSSMSSSAAS